MENYSTKKTEWLEFTYKNSGEAIRFPIGTVYGKEDGPTMVVLGGMHGSEFCGIQAAIDLYNTIDPEKLKGTVIIGMIYNMPAFLNHTAFVVPQDGKDPSGAFPGKLDGTYSEIMAHHFNENILSKADYYIELHGGDIPEALTPFIFAPVTGNTAVDEKIKEMAIAYNIKDIIYAPIVQSAKSSSAFAKTALRGIPSLLTESGQQGILNLDDAKVHLTGILNVLVKLGMLEGEIVNTVKRVFLERQGAIFSEAAGMWYPFVKLDQMVIKDEIIGEVRDYFGNHLADVKSPSDGKVIVIRTSPSVGVGNVIVQLYKIVGVE